MPLRSMIHEMQPSCVSQFSRRILLTPLVDVVIRIDIRQHWRESHLIQITYQRCCIHDVEGQSDANYQRPTTASCSHVRSLHVQGLVANRQIYSACTLARVAGYMQGDVSGHHRIGEFIPRQATQPHARQDQDLRASKLRKQARRK